MRAPTQPSLTSGQTIRQRFRCGLGVWFRSKDRLKNLDRTLNRLLV